VKRRTLRGQFVEGTTKRLVVDDGRLNHGYRVVSFVVAGEPAAAGNDCWATLCLDYDAPQNWDWGDNRQIGWAATHITASSLDAPFTVIDPDHIVIMDLYIQGRVGASGGTSTINYLIELEPVELSNDQAILTLIKERSQDDLR
jgi:hypothetical protein